MRRNKCEASRKRGPLASVSLKSLRYTAEPRSEGEGLQTSRSVWAMCQDIMSSDSTNIGELRLVQYS
jgi:hypothetical protein